MGQNDILSGMILELRRGTIVLCVLKRLHRPMYGYNLISDLTQRGIPVEANTLYPLLRRLETQGLLESRWDTGEAKPRKYYETTAQGREICAQLENNWRATVDSIDSILRDQEEEK